MSTARRPSGPPRKAMIRWSWRMFRKEWRQQLLVLSLITVAVAIAVTGSTMAMNAAGATQPEFGSATALTVLDVDQDRPAADIIASVQERFGTVEAIGHQSVDLPGSSEPLELRAQDPRGHFSRSTIALRDGRYPTGAAQIALTRDVADLLGVQVGDRTQVGDRERTVVGIVENPRMLGEDFGLVAPDQMASSDVLSVLFNQSASPPSDRAPSGSSSSTGRTASFDGPIQGRGDNGPVGALVLVVVALAMTLVGLVAASGFVVVAQRRQRQLGLLAAIGAGERHLRLVVVANGTIVGIVAAITGLALGLTGWILGAPAVEQAAGRRIARFDLPWAIVLGCVVVAVLMATVAAWWPARRLSRMPIMAALSGRPAKPAPVHRSLLAASILLAGGVVAIASAIGPKDRVRPLLLIAGVVAVAIGTVFVAPAAIRAGTAPAGRMPFAGRLALRDLGRYQGRAAAALAAITFVVGLSVTVVAIAGANAYRADEGNLSDHQILVQATPLRPGEPLGPTPTAAQVAVLDEHAADVAATIDGADLFALDVARHAGTGSASDPMVREPISEARQVDAGTWNHRGFPPVATPELLAHLGIDPASIHPDTELIAADTDHVVLLDITDRGAPDAKTKVQHADLPAYTSGPKALITEHAIAQHGWERYRAGWLLESPHTLTSEQIAAARKAAARAGFSIEVRSTQDGLAALRTISTGVGTVLALAIVAMTVGLIRSESARDLRTLTATGATSRTRRALTACTAGALALLGALLGTAGAAAALAAGYHRDLSRLTPLPWSNLVAILVGLPLLASAAGWLLAGREPKGFSRQTFD